MFHIPSSDFPSDILKWMKINAKPKMSLKLMKCNKYFQHFPRFPYFVVKEIAFCNDRCYCTNYQNKIKKYDNIEQISTKKLFWITENIFIYGISNLASLLTAKIAVSDIKKLTLDKQNLSFNEFKLLTETGYIENVEFTNTNITFQNGDPVFVDYILQCLPNIENFQYFNNSFSEFSPNFIDTFKNIQLPKLKFILLNMLSFSTFEVFSKFMEQNPKIEYDIGFHDTLLSDEETVKLQIYAQQILNVGITKYPPPFISFKGQTEEQFDAFYLLSQKFDEKHNSVEN